MPKYTLPAPALNYLSCQKERERKTSHGRHVIITVYKKLPHVWNLY